MTIPIVYVRSSCGVRGDTFQVLSELEGLESVARVTPVVTTAIDIWNIHTFRIYEAVFNDLPFAGNCRFF